MSVAVFDFIPTYCPRCGEKTGLTGTGAGGIADYVHHASHYCRGCGLGYQYVETENILSAADRDRGDLRHHFG
jgi:hypothetical protein